MENFTVSNAGGPILRHGVLMGSSNNSVVTYAGLPMKHEGNISSEMEMLRVMSSDQALRRSTAASSWLTRGVPLSGVDVSTVGQPVALVERGQHAGPSNITPRKPIIGLKHQISEEIVCNCQRNCRDSIAIETMRRINSEIWNAKPQEKRNRILTQYIKIKINSKAQTRCDYYLPDRSGNLIQVCHSMFLSMLGTKSHGMITRFMYYTTQGQQSTYEENLKGRRFPLKNALIDNPCKCPDRMNHLVPIEVRQYFHDLYWNANNAEKQEILLKSINVIENATSSSAERAKAGRAKTCSCTIFGRDGKEYPVCRVMFVRTLGTESQHMITKTINMKKANTM